jgi:ParB-like chromosome segregation protein Spo0J
MNTLIMTSGEKSMGFEKETRVIPLDNITPLRILPPAIRLTVKYRQVLASVRSIGFVEYPVVSPNTEREGIYFLLDGLLRLEIARELGWTQMECLVSTDDESFTYNKRVSRLTPVQEHNMIARAIERGVPDARLAEALNLDVSSVRRRYRMLDGICQEAVEKLSDKSCPMTVFEILKRLMPARQIEAVDLMVGQRNYSTPFIKAILAASSNDQLVGRKRKGGKVDISREEISRLERELYSAQSRTKYVEETYGEDNLQLTIAKTYLSKLLKNPVILKWLQEHQPDYLAEFQEIADMSSLKVMVEGRAA